MSKDNVIAFIHAKGHSKRVKNKNLKKLKNRPLIYYAIKKAIKCKLIDKVVIDSDSQKILDYGESLGAIPIKRPKRLASNKVGGDDLAVYQASLFPSSKICLQLVPTSPLIKIKTIEECIRAVQSNYDSAITVFSDSFYEWKNKRPIYYIKGRLPNGIELPKKIFETTGLYVNKTISILKLKRRFNYKSCFLKKVKKIETIDLNTYDDFDFAESIKKNDYNN